MIKDITAAEANVAEYDAVIDVRTKPEFDNGHIKNAVNIDIYGNFEVEVSKLDREKTYLVYCRTGSRSRMVLSIMESLGFNILHLQDGILEWEDKGFNISR